MYGPTKRKFRKTAPGTELEVDTTQEGFANEIGLTVESISNVERGIHCPKFDNL